MKKILVFFLAVLLLPLSVAAQNTVSVNLVTDLTEQEDDIEDLRGNVAASTNVEEEVFVYNIVEQPPHFPGGEAALLKYIAAHLKYPEEGEVQGVVNLRMVINEDGTVGEVKVTKSLWTYCDREAIRVAKSLPRFIPGKLQGKAVKVWFSLPVRFQLQ